MEFPGTACTLVSYRWDETQLEEREARTKTRASASRVYKAKRCVLGSSFTIAKIGAEMQPGTELDPELTALLEKALRAAENSYSPYSRFQVGAALRLTGGETVTGTNVENASFGLTICAERAALVRAVSQFGPQIRVAAVAVTNLNGCASPPCGACRQVLAEFTAPETPVVFPAPDGICVMPFGELLPLGFFLAKK